MSTKKITKFSYLLLLSFTLLASSVVILYEPNDKVWVEKNSVDKTELRAKTSQSYRPFSVATSAGPHTIEIVDAWDSASNMVLEQVVETLFAFDLTDPSLPRTNLLAESYWWEDTTTLHIKLREGVKFHDGTDFDANAVKWNLDRLQYLINATGTNTGIVAQTKSLWSFPDGVTPIMDTILVDATYNLIITLNGAYAPFLNTLTYINSGMLSPTFHAADDRSFISLSEDICGTGPFVYDGYIPDDRVDFHAFENYWRGKANISEMAYIVFDDANSAHEAFLNNEVDWNLLASDQNIEFYETIPDIKVYHFTAATGRPSLTYFYMGVNNEKYNDTWRKAFAFAMNYTYIIEELRLGNAFRSYSVISPGFGAAFNSSLLSDPNVVPDDGDIAAARAILQSMGYGVGFSSDAEWIAVAEGSSPFKTVTYTYNLGNTFRQDLGVALTEWLKLIGVAVEDDGVDFSEFLNYLYDVTEPGNPDSGWDHLGMYSIGWGPDYPDPYNMLDPLFNPTSGSNSAQVNDPTLNTMMTAALGETDDACRNIIYQNIQSYLATKGFNHIPLYHSKIIYAHSVNLTKFPYNAINKLYFYPCEWIPQIAPIPLPVTNIFIDDYDPYHDWETTAMENEWCTGSGTFNDPYIIKDLTIDGEFEDTGIEIYNSNVYFRIENCTIYNSFYGIYLVNVNNSIIHNNSIYNTMDSGIHLEYSDNHEIYYNKLWDIDYFGITLSTSSDHCEVRNNVIRTSMGGIATIYGFDNSILDNSLINNQMGIGVGAAYNITVKLNDVINNSVCGILLQVANNTLVKQNLVMDNPNYGIYLYYYNYHNEIRENQIYNSGVIGLLIEPLSSDNTIFLNSFIGNSINAGDNGSLNAWDNGEIGNYWDDYIGVDANDDGIGDSPYFIGGSAGSIDNYPIYDDGPEIYLSTDADNPDDDGTFILTWTDPKGSSNYSVYQSSSFITEITGELVLLADEITELSLPLEGYSDGTYYFIVVAHDEYGNALSNCIQVNVELILPPTIIQDTIPEETVMSFTRTSQIIGSLIATSTSQILSVHLLGGADPGFSLDTTYTSDEDAGIYFSETTLKTTNQLEPGVHSLTLRIYNADGMYYDKIFTVIVYRQAQLNLRGEFDYLLRERIKISIIAYALDIEDQFLLTPTIIEGMVVHIKIVDYDGNVKVEEIMTCDADGVFHWDSVQTIRDLSEVFTEAIYIVQAWIEFPSDSYYSGGMDVIEFHIDPPGDEPIDPLAILGITGFSGLIGINITLAILLKRKRRVK